MDELLIKTQEYLDYIKEHYENVQKAWKEIQEKCSNMRFVWDDFVWSMIDGAVKIHDESKLSIEEFVPYRMKFFPTEQEKDADKIGVNFDRAWLHHKEHNSHHPQKWTMREKFKTPYDDEVDCVHMVVDWTAMSYRFGSSAHEFYEQNKDNINLPTWAVKFIYEIFKRLNR